MDLPSAWLTAGSCNLLWGGAIGRNPGAVPTQFLPPTPPLDGSFAWLRREPNVNHAMEYREQELRSVASLLRDARTKPHCLDSRFPKTFWHF